MENSYAATKELSDTNEIPDATWLVWRFQPRIPSNLCAGTAASFSLEETLDAWSPNSNVSSVKDMSGKTILIACSATEVACRGPHFPHVYCQSREGQVCKDHSH